MQHFDAVEQNDLRALRKMIREGADLGVIDEESGVTPLAVAAESGYLDIVNILLRAGVNPNWGGATTPLEAAALEGHTAVAEALIRAFADVNRPVADGFTPLITAASTGHLAMVRMLLDAGANPAVADDEGNTALQVAQKKGHEDVVNLLKKYHSNGHRDRRGSEKGIFATLSSRDVVRLKELLNKGNINLDVFDHEKLTPLARAAQLGHVSLVRALLEAGAKIDEGGAKTPLFCAVENLHDPVVDVLLEEGAQLDLPSGEDARTPLMAAAATGNVETLRLLLEEGADAALLDAGEKNALWHAAEAGQTQTFEILAQLAADEDRAAATAELEKQTGDRKRLATSAARLIDHLLAGDVARAKTLLASGLTDPDGFDEEGRTALMLAAGMGRRDLVRMLTGAGASFELRDDTHGYTALIHAIRSTAPDPRQTLSLLAAAGVNLNRPSTDGRPPLFHAIEAYLEREDDDPEYFRNLVEPLIHMGADVAAKDADGRTAWAWVEEQLLDESFPEPSRQRLDQVRRILDRNGGRTGGGRRLDLMTAVTDGRTGKVRELLQKLKDPRELDSLPLVPLAAANDDWEIVTLLVSSGVDINKTSPDGQTALMEAAVRGHLPIVEELVRAGADVSLTNSSGETAAALAAGAGHSEIVELLDG